MERLTDSKRAQAIKENVEKLQAANVAVSPDHLQYIKLAEYEDKLESGEYAPQIIGKWIKGLRWDQWYCSVCSTPAILDWEENPILSNYCPECGAKLKEGD